jgi:hypothetical protein
VKLDKKSDVSCDGCHRKPTDVPEVRVVATFANDDGWMQRLCRSCVQKLLALFPCPRCGDPKGAHEGACDTQ